MIFDCPDFGPHNDSICAIATLIELDPSAVHIGG
jgi:hypothetical protein